MVKFGNTSLIEKNLKSFNSDENECFEFETSKISSKKKKAKRNSTSKEFDNESLSAIHIKTESPSALSENSNQDNLVFAEYGRVKRETDEPSPKKKKHKRKSESMDFDNTSVQNINENFEDDLSVQIKQECFISHYRDKSNFESVEILSNKKKHKKGKQTAKDYENEGISVLNIKTEPISDLSESNNQENLVLLEYSRIKLENDQPSPKKEMKKHKRKSTSKDCKNDTSVQNIKEYSVNVQSKQKCSISDVKDYVPLETSTPLSEKKKRMKRKGTLNDNLSKQYVNEESISELGLQNNYKWEDSDNEDCLKFKTHKLSAKKKKHKRKENDFDTVPSEHINDLLVKKVEQISHTSSVSDGNICAEIETDKFLSKKKKHKRKSSPKDYEGRMDCDDQGLSVQHLKEPNCGLSMQNSGQECLILNAKDCFQNDNLLPKKKKLKKKYDEGLFVQHINESVDGYSVKMNNQNCLAPDGFVREDIDSKLIDNCNVKKKKKKHKSDLSSPNIDDGQVELEHTDAVFEITSLSKENKSHKHSSSFVNTDRENNLEEHDASIGYQLCTSKKKKHKKKSLKDTEEDTVILHDVNNLPSNREKKKNKQSKLNIENSNSDVMQTVEASQSDNKKTNGGEISFDEHDTNIGYEHCSRKKKKHKKKSLKDTEEDTNGGEISFNEHDASIGYEHCSSKKKKHKKKSLKDTEEDTNGGEISFIEHDSSIGYEYCSSKKKKHKKKSLKDTEEDLVVHDVNDKYSNREKKRKHDKSNIERDVMCDVESGQDYDKKNKSSKNQLKNIILSVQPEINSECLNDEPYSERKKLKKKHESKKSFDIANNERSSKEEIYDENYLKIHNNSLWSKVANENSNSDDLVNVQIKENYDNIFLPRLQSKPKLNFDEDPVDFEIPLLHASEKAIMMSAETEQELKSKGVEIKKGRFTAEEDSILKRNYEDFTERYQVHDAQLLLGHGRRRRNDEVAKFLKAKHFYARIGKDLNNRSIRCIYMRLRTLYDPSLNRNNEPNNHHIKKRLLGRWTPDEIEIIVRAVKVVTGSDDLSKIDVNSIPWQNVANFVPTRNALQCQNYFLETFSGKLMKRAWDENGYKKLISILANECYVEDPRYINWKSVQEHFGDSAPPCEFLRKKWYTLKTRFPPEMNVKDMLKNYSTHHITESKNAKL